MALLLTDGTVLVQQYQSNNWYRLTPDASGSYIGGTLTQVDSLPSNFKPLYYASAVLADGRVIVMGGEYNYGGGGESLGAIFDPTVNPPTGRWTAVSAPTFFTTGTMSKTQLTTL